jgi:hypothetical protein
LLTGDAARGAWRDARATVALEQMDAACQSLLPLVYQNLAGLGEAPDLDALKALYIDTWGENQRRCHAVIPLVRAFDRAGLDAVVLKGLALIARFYRDPGLRPMADVDVLVRPADVERAGALAVDLGWEPRYPLTRAFRRVKHAAPFHHPIAGVACDIHWRVFEEATPDVLDDAFRAAAEPIAFQGTPLRVLAPTDQLLHVCGHAGRWDPVPPIRWAADAAVIVREGPIEWPRFVLHAAERRFVLRMRHMLAYLREALGVAIPAAVLTELERQPVSILERMEHRIRTRAHPLLGELPVYVFNCLRAESRPLRSLPGYLRDAWDLPSLATVVPHAFRLAARRVRTRTARPEAPRVPTPEGACER